MMLFLFSILFAIAAIVLFKRMARKSAFQDRQPMMFEEIYSFIERKNEIKFSTFTEVYHALESCYGIDPRLLRPSDPLKKLIDLDSWNLDAGTEKLEEWLLKTYQVQKPRQNIITVLDLLYYIEKAKAGEA